MAGNARPRPWRRSWRSSILSGRTSAPLQTGARPPRGLPAALLACRLPVVRGAGRGEAHPGGGRGRHRGARGRGLPALPIRKGRPTRRLCTRRRGRPTRGPDGRSGRFWPGDDPGEGQSYMGSFPRPIGKRFSRARRSAPWGPVRAPVGRGEGRGRSGTPGRDYAETCIFIRHHNMWCRPVRLSRDFESPPPFFGALLCGILDANFGEHPF